MTLFLVLVLAGIRSGNVYHTDNWMWNVSSWCVHWLGHFQLSMSTDKIATFTFKIRSSSISSCSWNSTAVLKTYIRWVYNRFSLLTNRVSYKIKASTDLTWLPVIGRTVISFNCLHRSQRSTKKFQNIYSLKHYRLINFFGTKFISHTSFVLSYVKSYVHI